MKINIDETLPPRPLRGPSWKSNQRFECLAAYGSNRLHLGCLQYKLPNFLETGIGGRCDNLLCSWVTHLIEVEDTPEVLHLNRYYPLLIDMPLRILSFVKETKIATELAAMPHTSSANTLT